MKHPLAQKLRDMHSLAGASCDPEFNRALLDAAREIDRLNSNVVPLTKEVTDYIGRYGGFCRDCADENGICPTSGLPCAGREKTIRHVITAYNYGVAHGFIHNSSLTSQEKKP